MEKRDAHARIIDAARSIASLAPAVLSLESLEAERADVARALERGYFTPDEDARLRAWFARYLTTRAGLVETLADLRPLARGGTADREAALRAFVVAYTAACLLVRSGRLLVGDLATDKIVQRKLNEAEPRLRIPRKQYTRIFRALTSPANAWSLHQAVRYAEAHRAAIDALAGDAAIAPVLEILRPAEEALRIDVSEYLEARVRYRWHSWRRRRASAAQKSIFRVLEATGRVVADVRSPWHGRDRVSAAVRREVETLLRPGDVLVLRHDRVLSNLFLPGYWPHAALHVGPAAAREAMEIEVDAERAARWVDPLCVLEARKDGVRFRALPDTFAVDAFAIIRPRLTGTDLARALSRAVAHEGKLYNFDFDFFTSDRLVCTEVVYRAYEDVGGLSFRLVRRGGRLTLSAEDILDMAVDDRGFEPVAVFGTPKLGARLVTGEEARGALVESYRGEGMRE